MKKGIIIGSSILIGIAALVMVTNVKNSKEKKEIVKRFYNSYESKDINLYNEFVIDELKEKDSEETQRRKDKNSPWLVSGQDGHGL